MGDQSFPSSHRLLKSAEFDAVFKKREFSTFKESLLILAIKNKRNHNRLGMIIGKKNVPRAIDRNTIKRQLRERFRHHEPMGLDVVALIKPGFCIDSRARTIISKTLDDLYEKVI